MDLYVKQMPFLKGQNFQYNGEERTEIQHEQIKTYGEWECIKGKSAIKKEALWDGFRGEWNIMVWEIFRALNVLQ